MKEKLLKAKYGSPDRPLRIGDVEIPCYVLEDGTRVLTQHGFYEAIGRSGKPAKGRGSAFEKVAPFLALKNLQPFIDQELIEQSRPISFRIPSSGVAWGFEAEILPRVCDVYIQAMEAGKLLKTQEKFAAACEIIKKGLAHVGIIALVDEATGYQYVRARDSLNKILDRFIAKELQKWAKTFPDEFYERLFRLRGWHYVPFSVKRPSFVGKLTNNLIYARLAPGVLQELRQKNPVDYKGRRKVKHFQWLTEHVGHPRLREHLAAVIALMRAAPNWTTFKSMINRALPKYDETLPILFPDGKHNIPDK